MYQYPKKVRVSIGLFCEKCSLGGFVLHMILSSNKVQLPCTNMHYVYHPFIFMNRYNARIFQVYFWESANETNDYNQSLPTRIKAWHNTIYYLDVVLKKAESSGEFIANLLGLNEGPFNYVTDSMTEDQMASSQRRLDEQSSSSIVGEQQKKDDNDDVGA